MDKQNAYTGIFPLKREEIPLRTTAWMKLEDIMLKEGSHKEKHHMRPFVWGTWSRQMQRDKVQKGGCQGWGRGNGELLFDGDRGSALQDGSVLAVGRRTAWTYETLLKWTCKNVRTGEDRDGDHGHVHQAEKERAMCSRSEILPGVTLLHFQSSVELKEH